MNFKKLYSKLTNLLSYRFIKILGLILLLVLGYSLAFGETPDEKQKRIIQEIEIAQMRNISMATKEINLRSTEKEQLLSRIKDLDFEIMMYDRCIMINETKDIPTNCRDVEVSLKDDLGWRTNSNGVSQEYRQLIGDTPKARAEYLLDGFAHAQGTIDIWLELGHKYKIDPYLAIAIAKADSSLGNQLKSKNNIGNVGNNDRGDTVEYATKKDGIEAIFRVLNNKYLGSIYTVGYLSCGGKTELGIQDCFQNGEKVYATSKENWNINVINTLRLIYRDASIDETYNFRIK